MSNQPVMAENQTKQPGRPVAPRISRPWQDLIHREQRWFREHFSREQVISYVKTLAWVVPMTLLIWVYAEREQIRKYENQTVPFDLKSVDPNRAVSLVRKQDKNLLVSVEGPQARVQDVLQKLSGGLMPQGVTIEIGSEYTPNRTHEIPSMVGLLQRQRIFRDNGITVLTCQPSRMEIMVDEVVERDAAIVPKPEVQNLDDASAFDPPVVKVKGPQSLLDEAAKQNGGKLVVYAEIPEDVLKTPGRRDTDVTVVRPESLRDDRVSLALTGKVRASLEVRSADVSGTISAMPVFITAPDGLQDKYKVVFKNSLQNVTVTGPREIIEKMALPGFEPGKARIEVTNRDIGGPKLKPVEYDLPKGVKPTKESLERTVEVNLVEKTAGES